MFLNPAVFKRMVTRAYKDDRLRLEHTTDGWYAFGASYWSVEVKEEYMTNKVKSALVELIGFLPARGEAFWISSGEEPEELDAGDVFVGYQKRYWELGTELQDTNIRMRANGANEVIMQSVDTFDKVLMNTVFLDMVDPRKIDKDRGETYPENPRLGRGGDMIIWANNVMALMCFKRCARYQKEDTLLKLIDGLDMRWEFVESEEIITSFKSDRNRGLEKEEADE